MSKDAAVKAQLVCQRSEKFSESFRDPKLFKSTAEF